MEACVGLDAGLQRCRLLHVFQCRADFGHLLFVPAGGGERRRFRLKDVAKFLYGLEELETVR
ncbi:hypothetical protein D3C85_1906530 [compost metagenome]